MEKTTKLRGVGSSTPAKEQRVIRVELDGTLTIVVQAFTPYDGEWKVIFDNPVGTRILDERDAPEFWHISVEYPHGEADTVVCEVIKGGWLDQQRPHSPIMQSGFYANLKEYLIGGDTNCVSVLSESEPKICRIDKDLTPHSSGSPTATR